MEMKRVANHDLLCRIEKEKLRKRGFEVVREKKLFLEVGRNYIVDIYAERNSQVLVVECGWLPKSKLEDLQKVYRTIHVPYLECWMPTTPYDPMEGERWKKYEVA